MIKERADREPVTGKDKLAKLPLPQHRAASHRISDSPKMRPERLASEGRRPADALLQPGSCLGVCDGDSRQVVGHCQGRGAAAESAAETTPACSGGAWC